MSHSIAALPALPPPESFRERPRPAKASLRVPNSVRKQDEWSRDADDCGRAISLARMTMKDAADELGMGVSQLSDQLHANERPQTERWRSSDRLRGPYLIAQAERQPDLFDIVTTIHVRRTA